MKKSAVEGFNSLFEKKTPTQQKKIESIIRKKDNLKDGLIRFSFLASEDQIKEIKTIARSNRHTMKDTMSDALSEFIDRHKMDKKNKI